VATLSTVLDQLNTEQRQAVTSSSPKTLVMAGAGSGKTSVLTARIAYLQERKEGGDQQYAGPHFHPPSSSRNEGPSG